MSPAMVAVDFLEPEDGGGAAPKEEQPLKLPKLPPATLGVVEYEPLQNTNYLTKNRVYSKMGSNGVLDAIPSVMHYGGFELEKVHKQTLRICNVAGYSTRCHVIPPTTPYFKIATTEKRGFMAPGMSESLTVEFCPTEHRYYYDCIRVHSEEANLLIPLHAYPVMNEVKFPSRIDFGRCQVGELHVKEVQIACKVPIDFEYELSVRGGDRDLQFEVDGMQGTVPANGIATVTIQYQPSKLATATMELELRVSEFGSSPVVCHVTGSGFPGVARDREVERVTGKAKPHTEELYSIKPVSERAFGTITGAGGGDGRGGAGGGDAYTRAVREVRRRRKMADGTWDKIPETTRVTLPPPPEEVMIDGLHVPADLSSTHAVSYVLNQTVGKLRIQDIQAMIDEKNREAALREGRLEEALTLTQGQSSDVVLDPLDDLSLGDDVREGMFLMQLQEAETHRRRMEMGFTMMSIGDDLLSDDHCNNVKQARVDHYLIHNHHQEQEHARLQEAVLENGSLLMVKAGDDELEPVSTANRWEPDRLGGEVEAVDGLEDQEPAWNKYHNDDWLKKAQSLERFVFAARKVVVQNRAQKRLNALQGLLRSCGRDKAKVQMLVSQELLDASSTSLTRPGLAPAQLFKPQKLCPAPLPVYRKNLFKDRAPVDPNYVADFDIVDNLIIKVPLKFKLLGYDEEPWNAIPSYLPPLLEQPLLAGAEEESSGGPVPTAVVPGPSAFPEMPQCFLETPFESNPIAGRYTDDALMAAPITSWGAGDAERIQPSIYAHEDTTETHDVGSNCCRALRGTPLLSDNWLPRREYWQVMPVEVPEIMLGADPRDTLPEDKDDLRRPQLKPHIPTEAEVEALLVSAAGVAAEEEAAAASAADKGGGKGGKGGKDKDAGKAKTLAEEVTESKGVRVDETREQQVSKDIPRRIKEAELEEAMLQRRQALVEELDKRVEAYNATLKMPCYFKLFF